MRQNQNRVVAIATGDLTYQGRPCKNCGTTEKYTANWGCKVCMIECTKSRSPKIFKKYQQSDKGKKWIKSYRDSVAHTTIQSDWRAKNYQKHKHKYIGRDLKKYGITLEQYNEKLLNQNNVCAICQSPPGKKRLAVDHNHTTGAVRDLLCIKCNTGLGLVNDNIELLKKLIEYLKRHNQ